MSNVRGGIEREATQATIRAVAASLGLITAVVGAGACSGNRDRQPVESRQAALTLEPVVSDLTVVLPSLYAPSDVVLSAGGSLQIADRVKVVGRSNTRAPIANVGTGETNVGVDASTGDIVSVPNVVLRGANRPLPFVNVEGSVRSTGTVTRQNNARVSGTITQNATIATRSYERRAVIPATAGPDVILAPDKTRSLTPGNYGNVTVFSRSTLTLAAGTYTFSRLQLEPDSKVVLQNANEPVMIYVKDEVIYRGRFQEQATGNLVGNVMLAVLSNKPIPVEAPFIGTLLAPRAAITLATVGAPGHKGAFFGKSLQVAPDSLITHTPFPSSLIVRVDVSKTPVCVNETTTVNVVTRSLSGTSSGPQPEVSINGLPGTTRNLQFYAKGARTVTITATQNGVAETRNVTINVQTCTQVFPDVVATPTLKAYEIEFTVANATALTGTNRQFVWTFGDGQTATTTFPYVTHSYLGAVDATHDKLQFEATLTVKRTGTADVATKKTVVIANQYVEMAKRGFVRPPVTPSTDRLKKIDKGLEGSFTIRNVEAGALQLTSKQIERHYCDPDLNPTLDASQTVSISIAGGATRTEPVSLLASAFGSNVCGISVHMGGTTADGLSVRVSAHFETPARSMFEAPVTDATLKAALNNAAAAGMVADRNRITFEDLRRLKLEQRIGDLPALQDISAGALQSSGDVIGQPCNEEDAPPIQGVSCQATEDWTITPPLLRNAQKGDVLIVASCETIGSLLRTVHPPQRYSHEGIMTRNYFALAESTVNEARILETVDGIGKIIGESQLKFGWPGGLRQSINTAFSTLHIVDPDGRLREINTFRPEPTRCDGDGSLNPPLLIHPPFNAAPSVRAQLRQAGDFAKTAETHYRFFGFSQANIAFDGASNFSGGNFRSPENEPATVSTTFIWFSLKSTGVPLEGNALEPYLRPSPTGALNEFDDGAELPTGAGIIDGLYNYTLSERIAGAEYIFNSTKEKVSTLQDAQAAGKVGVALGDALSGVVEFLTNQADEVAAQFTNCFASDKCGEDGVHKMIPDPANSSQMIRVLNQDFRNPGIGTAVSPDNFLFWDTPFYGDWEPVHYVSGEARRIHRWAATAATGGVHGVVTLQDGTLVSGALVTVAGQELSTDGAGAYRVTAIPAGSYEVRARKEIDGRLRFDAKIVQIDAGDDDEVNLVLTVDGPIPPTITVTERRISFSGTLHMHDDETFGSDENHTLNLAGTCAVSPLERNVKITTQNLGVPTPCSAFPEFPPIRQLCEQVSPQGIIENCAGGEVTGDVEVTCELLEDNATVRVTAKASVLEGDSCGGSGNIFDDPEAEQAGDGPVDAAPDCTACGSLHANPRLEGGDFSDLQLAITGNTAGASTVVNPILAENRRRVGFNGTVKIHDDDFGSSDEEGTFPFQEFCQVDPLDQDDEIEWSRCVDDEVRVEVHVTCNLAPDKISVNVSTKVDLFEETTCVNSDHDGDESRAVLVGSCDNGCTPSSLNSPGSGTVIKVNNEDEGGDFAEIDVSVTNNVQP